MAINAFGSIFSYHNGSAFAPVAEVHNISVPSISRDSIETTHHGSADGFREYLPGLKDAGEVSLDINWNPSNATHAALYNQITSSGGNQQYRVTFPGSPGATFTFTGHLTGFDASAPIDDRLTASVTIKLSGKPTLA